MSLIDKNFLKEYCLALEFATMSTHIRIMGIGNLIHDLSKYVVSHISLPYNIENIDLI